MKSNNKKLIIRQLDKKLESFRHLQALPVPAEGWIKLIRKTLNMSLHQVGSRMGITVQSVSNIEEREVQGTITLNRLKQVGKALDLQFVYGFIPEKETIEKMIEERALKIATNIVHRTSTTMKLEDQENSKERIKEAIAELAEEIKREMPKMLWD